MARTSEGSYGADLLPTYNVRGQPTGARLRQAYVEDVKDVEDEGEGEARYHFELRAQNQSAPAENLEWHGIEPTPMLGKSDPQGWRPLS